jgi:hypothetical protein
MSPKKKLAVLPLLAILLSVGGLAGFAYLFLRDFNVYWLILSPVILALYQVPAVFVFWLHKRRRAASARIEETKGQDEDPAQSGSRRTP